MNYIETINSMRTDIKPLTGTCSAMTDKIIVEDLDGFEYNVFILTLLKNRKLSILSAIDQTAVFVHRCKRLCKESYDYAKTVYQNNSTKVIITCSEHGDFEMLPSMHLEGQGCKICGIKRQGNAVHRNPLRGTKVYKAFYNMVNRCTKPTRKEWKHYGGRGIGVAEDLNTFEKFYEYVKTLPDFDQFQNGNLTLDRENNDGNYEKGNIRFVTWAVQARNKSNSIEQVKKEVEYE